MDSRCKAIHETSLGNIIDIVDSVKKMTLDDFANLKAKGKKTSMAYSSSITRASSNLTMVFPVLCSRNISIETASMISKALEKNYVSMLQRLFASAQIADSGDFNDYLATFHKNITTKAASLDDVFRIIDNSELLEATTTLNRAAIRDDMQNINFTLPDSVSESSLLDYRVSNGHVEERPRILREGAPHISDEDRKNATKRYNNTLDDLANRISSKLSNNTNTSDAVKLQNDMANYDKNTAEFFSKQILDSDYKKANELMPTSMVVKFYVKNGEGEPIEFDNCLAAVKCKLYPIGSDEVVANLSDKIGTKNWITQFFRASTREISFVKDFVLALDKAKMDALSMSERHRTKDKFWKILERRALSSRINKFMRLGNGASVAAITTLVISQEEVEYLRKYHSIDMEKVGAATTLFNTLNLMGLVIVDETLEVAKFIFDEADPSWETISFTHLERESSDNTYKRVVNLMTKIS